jgi:hypothetical protein
MIRTHTGQHGDGCFGCKIQTVQIAATATPTRGGAAVQAQKQREKELVKDLDAYKLMRKEGLHPNATKGAHKMAQRAESTFEVESGKLAADSSRKLLERKGLGPEKDPNGKHYRKRAQETHDEIRSTGRVNPVA